MWAIYDSVHDETFYKNNKDGVLEFFDLEKDSGWDLDGQKPVVWESEDGEIHLTFSPGDIVDEPIFRAEEIFAD